MAALASHLDESWASLAPATSIVLQHQQQQQQQQACVAGSAANNDPRTSFRKEFRRVFQRLKPLMNEWNERVQILTNTIESAYNLHPRLSMCTEDKNLGMLVHFAGFKDRLAAKQMQQWLVIVNTLEELMSQLRKRVHEVVAIKHDGDALYNSYCSTRRLDMRQCVERSSKHVAIADGVLWLECVSQSVSCEYATRVRITDAIIAGELGDTELLDEWRQYPSFTIQANVYMNMLHNQVPNFIDKSLLS